MGKAFEQRRCPALGREISAADCGDSRISRYACPADCEHNPFAPANYAQLLEIEDRLDKKTLNWLFADASDRAALAQAFGSAVDTGSPHAAHAFTSWRLFFCQGADDLTCAQRWERAGFLGLRNDERVLFRAKMQVRIALLEIRAVLDEQRLEAIDLFFPNRVPFRVVDRSLAKQAVRFVPLVAWLFPLPHFWRVSGTALVIPDWGRFEPEEIVTELARHLGGPTEPEPLRRWLAEHFVRLSEALDAAARVRFAGERLDDLGARLAMSEPPGVPSLVPPRLLEQAPRLQLTSSQLATPPGGSPEELLAEMEEAYRRAFPDQSLPALDGRTPREAARDPALRPRLVRLVKSLVRGHDEKNLKTGRAADLNWLLRELGLDELDVPAPPPRPSLETGDIGRVKPPDEEDDPREERDDEPGAYSPEPDPLPDEPFDPAEAARRLNIALGEFDTAAEALNELEASGATLVPDASELTVDLLSGTDFSYLVTFLLQAWFALVPPGCRAPLLRRPAMREALRHDMALVTPKVMSGSMETLRGIVTDCRQPALLQGLVARLFDSAKKMPKSARPTAGARTAMVVVLKVLLNELDHALRHP